jgi:NAD(P)H-dependent flavin oxidoreductase YrpB (nitropropane dioxygenase family)
VTGIRTPFTELLGVEHPVVSAGMAGGAAGGELAGAVSEAGGLGIVGASLLDPDRVEAEVRRARELTTKPIGVNLLLFGNEALIEPVLELEPAVLSTAWARDDQDLEAIFARAHERGAKVMHMVTTVGDAVGAMDAGADVVVAQGTEGGGHVGEVGTAVLVRQVAKAIPPVPVLAAGGLADGAGLVAALALGADGILMGTRFIATDEAAFDQFDKEGLVRAGARTRSSPPCPTRSAAATGPAPGRAGRGHASWRSGSAGSRNCAAGGRRFASACARRRNGAIATTG